MVFDDSVNVKVIVVLIASIPYLSRCENSGNVTSNVTSHASHGFVKINETSTSQIKLVHNVTVHGTASVKNANFSSNMTFAKKTNVSKSANSELEWMEGGPVHVKNSKSPNVHTVKINDTVHSVKTNVSSTAHAVHKYISARKGAPVEPNVQTKLNISHKPLSSPIIRPKPLFTMVQGDKIMKESESFIESPTTGKDYVLPIVLVIFAVPGFIFLVKFLYKRGTEFTERQQYHRMYLIDGMYNAR